MASRRGKTKAGAAPKVITDILDHREMKLLYHRAYDNQHINNNNNNNNNTATAGNSSAHPKQQNLPQKRVWMSSLDSVYGPYDGSKAAKRLGWEIFDRSKLVAFDGTNSLGKHPMNEILELELEILLILLNQTMATTR